MTRVPHSKASLNLRDLAFSIFDPPCWCYGQVVKRRFLIYTEGRSIIVSATQQRRQKNRGQNNGVYYFPVVFFCPIAETMINALRSGEASDTLELFAIACTYQYRER